MSALNLKQFDQFEIPMISEPAETPAVPTVSQEEETLALDVVDELGPEGDYLSHDHTYRHFKDAYYSKLADRRIYSAWESDGSMTMAQRAALKVDAILENHQPNALPDDVKKALREYVERAQGAVSNL